ncbi:hypothetical protein K438DRAFT_1131816 [Mycena galopus ATCC 62051]|nr:hypothetical protein K438DRAFT_1131816 [Mycena galopus ATCC 62051]
MLRILGSPATVVQKDPLFSWISRVRSSSESPSFSNAAPGTYISVNGRIGNDSVNTGTQVSFSIDGATPVIFSAPYQSSISYNQALFQSSNLAQGNHSIVATSQSGTLWVDYLLVQPDPSTNVTLLSAPAHPVNIGEIAGAAGGALFIIDVGLHHHDRCPDHPTFLYLVLPNQHLFLRNLQPPTHLHFPLVVSTRLIIVILSIPHQCRLELHLTLLLDPTTPLRPPTRGRDSSLAIPRPELQRRHRRRRGLPHLRRPRAIRAESLVSVVTATQWQI